MPSHPLIDSVEVDAYTIPTDTPEEDGTLAWDQTTIVVAHARAGNQTGLGYTYADLATAKLIESKLADVVRGLDATAPRRAWAAMVRAIRNLGRPGIASMAISAVDVALWDLHARLLDTPLCSLLGDAHECVPVYGSGGFTNYSDRRLQSQLAGWVSEGIPRVKMKIGANPSDDARRVALARETVGSEAELFVDANGAYQRKQALDLAHRFRQDTGVSWFEEPVSSDDLAGLRLLRDRGPEGMAIAAGEYGYDAPYFERMLAAQSVDVIQADVTRCGGVTGILAVGAMSDARNLPISCHCGPAIHAHVAAAIGNLLHLEYFHDHTRIERMIFDGLPELRDGALWPDRGRAGMGLELKRRDAQTYSA